VSRKALGNINGPPYVFFYCRTGSQKYGMSALSAGLACSW
jgi:hypothetical protein